MLVATGHHASVGNNFRAPPVKWASIFSTYDWPFPVTLLKVYWALRFILHKEALFYLKDVWYCSGCLKMLVATGHHASVGNNFRAPPVKWASIFSTYDWPFPVTLLKVYWALRFILHKEALFYLKDVWYCSGCLNILLKEVKVSLFMNCSLLGAEHVIAIPSGTVGFILQLV